jgi:LacI family transcriptional regulator
MTLVVSSERDADLEFEQAKLMADRKVSGLLIVTSTSGTDERLHQLQSTGLAIVAFDRPLPGAETDCVVVDNRAGAENAVSHLIGHGHHHIACVGYDEAVYTVRERIQGYTSCMHAARLKPQLGFALTTLEHVRSWLTTALAAKNPPTAIFSINHRTSIHLLEVLMEKKIKIPEQMAIVGFDDFDLAGVITPPLTTVSQSAVELARRSMGLLMEGIRGAQSGITSTPAKVVLPTKLMVRASCGSHPV